MPAPDPLPCGLYETLLDEELAGLLENRPDLIATLVTIDDESAPHSYSQFLWQVIRQALSIAKADRRIEIGNRLIELLSAEDGLEYTRRKILLETAKNSSPRSAADICSSVIAAPRHVAWYQQPSHGIVR